MQKSKTILLALIFSMSMTFTIFYFIGSILNTIKPIWFEGDEGNGNIFWWVFFGIFFLSSLSSILWLAKSTNKFWLLKIPSLIIFPFSIPFLIIDYLDFKKTKDNYSKKENEVKKWKWIVLLVVCLLNYVMMSLQLGFLIPISFAYPWVLGFTIVPFLLFLGSFFLILDYFYPKKVFAWLSALGLTLNWFYLFLKLVEKRKVNYFFKTTKIPNNEQTNI